MERRGCRGDAYAWRAPELAVAEADGTDGGRVDEWQELFGGALAEVEEELLVALADVAEQQVPLDVVGQCGELQAHALCLQREGLDRRGQQTRQPQLPPLRRRKREVAVLAAAPKHCRARKRRLRHARGAARVP